MCPWDRLFDYFRNEGNPFLYPPMPFLFSLLSFIVSFILFQDMAPEVFKTEYLLTPDPGKQKSGKKEDIYGCEVDVFSFGLVVYFMLHGEHALKTPYRMYTTPSHVTPHRT